MEENEDFKDVKKKSGIIKFLIPVIGVLLIVIGAIFLLTSGGKESSSTNTKPDLKDDYFDSINYLNKKDPMGDAQQVVYSNLIKTIQEIENDPNHVDEDYDAYIELFEDTDYRDERGLEDLMPYFNAIDNASTMDEFNDVVVNVGYDFGLSTFLNIGLMADYYDTSKNIITLQPMILENLGTVLLTPGLPSGLEFFTNDDYKQYKTALEKARISYFKLYGYDEEKATQVSNDITEFAKTIQKDSLAIDDFQENYIDYYQPISYNELKELISNLPLDKYLAKYNISNSYGFGIYDKGHLTALNNFYKEENLPLLKEILKMYILEEVASINTTTEFAEVFVKCYNDITGERITINELMPYYDNIMLKPQLMGSYLMQEFDKKYFPEEDKQEVRDLISKIQNHYKQVIQEADWLDDSTKQEALKKLDNLNIKVGYVQEAEDIIIDFTSKSDGGTLIGNFIKMNQAVGNSYAEMMKTKIPMTVDQAKVNAAYIALNNSINFPVSFREVYRGITDKYEIYGYAGMIIAHEISHAFDNHGARYDENGNINNWWTEKDKQSFDERKQKIVDYYSKYELFGIKMDGVKTAGENIADLGSISTLISIMESENATNEDFKKFFEAYAKLWNEELTKSKLELQMASDNHSPNKIRVNGVLSSMDKFYEVYGIKEGDKMYIAKEDRVGIWK